MASPNRYRPFTPDPEQLALTPAVSGNTINGLGETERRQPRLVYWAPDPDTIPHGAMQRWFYEVDPGNLDLKRARDERAKLLSSPMPEVTGEPVERHPEEWNAALAALAEGRIFDMWGVAKMDPLWVYEGQNVSQQTIIMLGFAHTIRFRPRRMQQLGLKSFANMGGPQWPRSWSRASSARLGYRAFDRTDDVEGYDDPSRDRMRLRGTWQARLSD
jgi:hypothetical protein